MRYYSVFMIYPLKGSPYPKVTFTAHHPFYEWVNIAKYVKNEVPIDNKPYKIVLTFWKEVKYEGVIEDFEDIDKAYDFNDWKTLAEEYKDD